MTGDANQEPPVGLGRSTLNCWLDDFLRLHPQYRSHYVIIDGREYADEVTTAAFLDWLVKVKRCDAARAAWIKEQLKLARGAA